MMVRVSPRFSLESTIASTSGGRLPQPKSWARKIPLGNSRLLSARAGLRQNAADNAPVTFGFSKKDLWKGVLSLLAVGIIWMSLPKRELPWTKAAYDPDGDGVWVGKDGKQFTVNHIFSLEELAQAKNRGVVERFILYSDGWRPYAQLYKQAGKDNGFDEVWLIASHLKESHFDTAAVSKSGAEGIPQFIAETANDLGVTNRKDPNQAIPASGKYLNWLYTTKGLRFMNLVYAAYNGGPKTVKDANYRIKNMSQETQDYVPAVMTYVRMYKDAEFRKAVMANYIVYAEKTLNGVQGTINDYQTRINNLKSKLGKVNSKDKGSQSKIKEYKRQILKVKNDLSDHLSILKYQQSLYNGAKAILNGN